MCWNVARQFGKWPWEVYEQMPLDWLWFGQGLSIRQAEETKKAMSKAPKPRQRTTMGGQVIS